MNRMSQTGVWFVLGLAAISCVRLAPIAGNPTAIAASPGLTSAPTQLPVPTMASDEALVALRNILDGAPDCRLPCWAGITPGLTPQRDARDALSHLVWLLDGAPPYLYKGVALAGPGGGRDFAFGDLQVALTVGWRSEPGQTTVDLLEIGTEARTKAPDGTQVDAYGAPAYRELFGSYGLQGMLNTYGRPDRTYSLAIVYLEGNDTPYPNPEEFQILMAYDQGILLSYRMPLRRLDDDTGQACPQEALVSVWLTSPDRIDFYKEMWSSSFAGSRDFESSLPVEQAAQLSEEQFYRTFRGSMPACLTTPLSIWPAH